MTTPNRPTRKARNEVTSAKVAAIAAKAMKRPTVKDGLAFVDKYRELIAAVVVQAMDVQYRRCVSAVASALTQAPNKRK